MEAREYNGRFDLIKYWSKKKARLKTSYVSNTGGGAGAGVEAGEF